MLKVVGTVSKVVEVLLEVLEAHFVFVDLGVLVAVLYFVEGDLPADRLEHHHYVLGNQVPLPALRHTYF